MSTPDMHKEDFDEATAIKLSIFRQYLNAWIPVFPKSNHPKIRICDYFAGPGHDASGNPGSPIIAINQIAEHRATLGQSRTRVILRLNEFKPSNMDLLTTAAERALREKSLSGLVDLNITSKDFGQIYKQEIGNLRNPAIPSFIFIDQYGVKHVTETVFSDLCNLPKTDFMFFISSSFFKRFSQESEFSKYHPKMNAEDLRSCKLANIHRKIREYYQSLVPNGNETKVYSFTLKKGFNIYGLIFCTSHRLGADKFLEIAWKENGINGEANFDLDNDAGPQQMNIFQDKKLTKMQAFEKRLQERIFAKEIRSNRDAYDFCLEEGFLPSLGKDVIKSMISSGFLVSAGNFGMSYKTIFKERRVVSLLLTGRSN